jgi:hypothetical protein
MPRAEILSKRALHTLKQVHAELALKIESNREVVGRQFVVASCDPTTLLDEIRTLSGASHRRILQPSGNRPHREETLDWCDRQ